MYKEPWPVEILVMPKTTAKRRPHKKPSSGKTHHEQFYRFSGDMKGKKTIDGCPCCGDIVNFKEEIMKKIHKQEIIIGMQL
jgi:hypothetical protein